MTTFPTTLTDLVDAACRDPEGLGRTLRRCTAGERADVAVLAHAALSTVQANMADLVELERRLHILLAMLSPEDTPLAVRLVD